ncbi:MAG: hypothetical protein HZB54_03520 [Deltaproteobacteria bacterium]|nr:hypothetical protein [Deltaproteobacteria bacterium]
MTSTLGLCIIRRDPHMFNDFKKRIVRESIFFERLRILLYLSMLKNVKIWLVLQEPDKYIDSAKIVSGVVDGLVNGTEPEPFHKRYLGRIVYFKNSKEPFNMVEIVAVSYHPINDVHEPFNHTRKDILNNIQHLDPFTGFGKGYDNNESHYYKVLSDFIG